MDFRIRSVGTLEQINKKNPLFISTVIFLICAAFHYTETLFIRTDETFLADNFMNKMIGIIVLLIALKVFDYPLRIIGFQKDKLHYLLTGFVIGFLCFTAAYSLEYLILNLRGQFPFFEWYVSGFSLAGEIVKQTGFIAYFLCVVFNIINVIMEEGVFRGLFIRLGIEKYSFTKANWFAAFLFGIWHLSMPVKSVIDGQMQIAEAAVMGIGYIILAMIMGVKWGLWLRNTKCLWFGIAEHFFNNTIGNMLHVVSSGGHDEMQIIRIIAAQMLSLIITLIINRRNKVKNISISEA
jgi:membrane protease YdiL (CAAX protease family)